MYSSNLLTVSLIILSVILAVLLVLRSIRSKKEIAVINKMKTDQFSEFLKINATDGSIVEVARRLSDILIKTFDCHYIIFLRKKRGVLELNYYHGIRNFNKTDFIIPYDQKLDSLFRNDYLPRGVKTIEKYLPEKFLQKNKQYGLDIFFPIFWRENLYGLYFIKSNAEISSEAFNILIAGLAQSLSAAYHIKWHEAKKESMAKHTRGETTISSKTNEGQQYVTKMLKLIKHKKTDTIVLKLIATLKEITGIENMVYLYETNSKDSIADVLIEGKLGKIPKLDNEFIKRIINELGNQPFYDINQIELNDYLLNNWIKQLKESGIEYITSLPLTNDRRGLLGWSQHKDHQSLIRQLELFKRHSIDLVENAENYETVEQLSYTDNLTKLSNQRYFFKRLSEEINRAERYNRKLALIIFDIDELKVVNDRYGHQAGDALISKMGEILKNSIRAIDVVARYGGDEFCVIMPEADQITCRKFMDRLIDKIRQTEIKTDYVDKPLYSTISIGGAIFPDHGNDVKKLIFSADMALLKAKELGRNQSVISTGNLTI